MEPLQRERAVLAIILRCFFRSGLPSSSVQPECEAYAIGKPATLCCSSWASTPRFSRSQPATSTVWNQSYGFAPFEEAILPLIKNVGDVPDIHVAQNASDSSLILGYLGLHKHDANAVENS